MISIQKLAELPPLLQEISDPPDQLYYRGQLPNWETHKFLTIVGSRRYSEYGRAVCEKLVAELAGLPIVIVSGLALGMDALAHQAALDAGITTVALPGSGLDDSVIAPRSNFGLAMKILDAGGALLSEFEPKQKAAKWIFPQRNRLVAGISHATLIIEATQKSGTLITSRLATEYNRDVMTVPGSIFRDQSVGPHMLLRLGAYPVTSGAEIADILGIKMEDKVQKSTGNLNSVEQAICDQLSEPRSKQFLTDTLPFSITEINIALSSLEIKEMIIESMGTIRRR